MKKVEHSQYLDFIENYPRSLEINIVGICEPPVKQYVDFNSEESPALVVAECVLNESMAGEKNDYYILEA